jgi:hypothetical protein
MAGKEQLKNFQKSCKPKAHIQAPATSKSGSIIIHLNRTTPVPKMPWNPIDAERKGALRVD